VRLKILFIVAAIACVACNADRTVDPAVGVDVTVDSAVYHLQPYFSWYWIEVKSSITNNSDHDIFIGQNCWTGQHVRRADATDKRQLLLGEYGCIEEELARPLRIEAGKQYANTWKVWGSNSPQTRPPITIDDNTGTMVMTFVLTDSAGKPIGRIASRTFDVVPPVPQGERDTLRITSGIGLSVNPDSVVMNHGSDHSYVNVNLRVHNFRPDAIAVDPCSWRVELRVNGAWQLAYAGHCLGPGNDQVVNARDSVDVAFRIEDSADRQASFHRGPIVTAVGRVFIDVSAGNERLNAESNSFALFATGFVLPSS